MSNYVVTTNFAAKDALAHGNAAKVAKGTELSAELNAIAVAVATKEDLANKNVNSGYAGLDATARILKAQAPSVTAYTDTGNVFTVAQTITPVSNVALQVNGVANSYTHLITGSSTASQSFGLLVKAGTNGADQAVTITNQANTRNLLTIAGDGTTSFGNSTGNPTFSFLGTGTVNVGGSLSVTGNVGGTFTGNGASVTNLVATNIATGVLLAARTGSSPAAARFLYTSDGVNNVWSTVGFTDLTGTASTAQIPALDTTKITTGTFADARIASTNVTQWQGSLAVAASQTTSGTFADARIASSNVTQFNSSINGRNISAKAGISKTIQSGGTAAGGSDGDIIYIY